MKTIAGFFIAFLLLASLPAAAREVSKTVLVGDTQLALPVIEGFSEVVGANAMFDGFASQLVPPTNRLLGVYLLADDAEAIKAGRQTAMKQYIVVQTLKSNITIKNTKDFIVLKAQVLKEAGAELGSSPDAVQQIESVSKYLKEHYNQDSKFEIGDTRILGAFIDDDRALGVSLLANVGIQAGGQEQAVPVAISLLALNVKTKPVFVTIYATYSGVKDSDFVEAAGREFTRQIQLANGESATAQPPAKDKAVPESAEKKDEEEASSGDIADSALNYSLIVTVVISGVALAFFILPPLFRRMSGNKDEAL